ncbi:MAG: carbohydrate kinase family protein [Gaiellaceae bacterium]
MRICALGDLLLDVIVRLDAPLAPDADAPAVTRTGAGGQAANVAAWAVSLGAEASVLCKLGDDPAASLVREEVEARGIAVRGPVVHGRTGVVVSLVAPEGTRTMASDRGVAPELTAEEIDPAWLEGVDVLHVSGYALLREPIARAALAAARLAPRVSLDLSSAGDIESYGVSRFRALVAELAPDLIFANEEEQDVLAGGLPAPEWVLKLGPRGCRFSDGHELPARAAEVVDPTGAGDALAAGYLVGGPEVALDAAGRCVGRMGAMP